MPTVASLLTESNTAEDTSELGEAIPLHLPSSLPSSFRNSPTLLSLAQKEARLRFGQADKALETIRQNRCMITGLTQFKKDNISGAGNKPNTHFRTVLNHLQTRIQLTADTYRTAYKALHILQPEGHWKTMFQNLHSDDIRGPGRQPDDLITQTQSRYEMSWIWLVGKSGSTDDSHENWDESMQAEWAKMKARQDRWNEEYQLIQEEMKRTVVYLEWKASWWKEHMKRRIVEDPILAQSLLAYSERQAYLWKKLAASCVEKWIPLLKKSGADILWAGQYQVLEDVETSEGEDDEDEVESWGKKKITTDDDRDIFDSYDIGD